MADGGKEYFSDKFNCYLQQIGIQREFCCRYTPEQNDVDKRKNRSIVEAARAMLKFYWTEAVQIGEKMSAHELYFWWEPNLRHLRVFDNIAYVHVLDEKRRKLGLKSEKCILVSYSQEQKGYKCYNPRTIEV